MKLFRASHFCFTIQDRMTMASRDTRQAVVDRFKLELHKCVAETLTSVCGAFKQELELAAQPPSRSTTQVDYDTYNDCCQRLVQYIAGNMDTSPYFTQQMDRIILACHSNTPVKVLGSLVTKDVWLRPREKQNPSEEESKEEIRGNLNGHGNNELSIPVNAVIKREIVEKGAPRVSETLPPRTASRNRSVSSTRQVVGMISVGPSSGLKRQSGRQNHLTTAPSAKRQRQEDQFVIEIMSTADEESTCESDSDADLFGLCVGNDTETEEENGECGANGEGMDFFDDEEDEDWVESENDSDFDDERDEESEITRATVVDTIGNLCCPDNRSPRQTKLVRERLRKSIQYLDALMCRPPPSKMCRRNCQKLREQWRESESELYQFWHEADAHVTGCRNKERCEYSIQIMLRETLHQIEHQHERIRNVRGEFHERKRELAEANASRLLNPPSKIALLNKQVELLEKELKCEVDQLECYYCIKRSNVDAAKKLELDTQADIADFQTHYVLRSSTHVTGKKAKQSHLVPAATVLHVSKTDDLLPSLDDVIGKNCFAGQRSQQQTEEFKKCLQKSITFIDALLCKPPVGKVCRRDCKKIRENRCSDDVPCGYELCRNWHNAEAHIDHCHNPQCEFKLRIVLREIRYGIEEKNRVVEDKRVKVQEKRLTLQHNVQLYKDMNSLHELTELPRHDRFLEPKVLENEIDQLQVEVNKEEQLLHELNAKMEEISAKLYTIGIDESDDVIDGFPDFATHYEIKRGPTKQRIR